MQTPATRLTHSASATSNTPYTDYIPPTYRDDVSNIQKAVKHIIDYLSFRNNTPDMDEKIGHLEFAIKNINEEITALRSLSERTPGRALHFETPSGGKRKTHKRLQRNKRRQTRARK